MREKQNPWRKCRSDPPPQYHRVEIKDKHNNRYVGYRCGKTYYETYGNYIIKEPKYWRIPPVGSPLIEVLKDKLKGFITEEQTAYGASRE